MGTCELWLYKYNMCKYISINDAASTYTAEYNINAVILNS